MIKEKEVEMKINLFKWLGQKFENLVKRLEKKLPGLIEVIIEWAQLKKEYDEKCSRGELPYIQDPFNNPDC